MRGTASPVGEAPADDLTSARPCGVTFLDPAQLIGAALEVRDNWSRRVGTGELNRWFANAIETNPPPAPSGNRIKLRYITQIKSRPPSFVVFGTRTDALPESYRRYLLNAMRRDLKMSAVPLRLEFRGGKNPFEGRPR